MNTKSIHQFNHLDSYLGVKNGRFVIESVMGGMCSYKFSQTRKGLVEKMEEYEFPEIYFYFVKGSKNYGIKIPFKKEFVITELGDVTDQYTLIPQLVFSAKIYVNKSNILFYLKDLIGTDNYSKYQKVKQIDPWSKEYDICEILYN